LPIHARACERHTGAGITADDVRTQSLPIPERDYLPETIEEKLICVADKFFSKKPSKLWDEKPVEKISKSLAKHGGFVAARWRALETEFLTPES